MTTTIELPRIAKLLTKVREVIVKHGWIQGSYSDDRGYCLVGAINYAVIEYGDLGHGVDNTRVRLALWATIDNRPFDLIAWNDKEGRTVQEVLEVIDKTIAREIAPLLERR